MSPRTQNARPLSSLGFPWRPLMASVVALPLLATGCTQDQWARIMGEGFHDDMAKSGGNLRGGCHDGSEFDGLSTKSREIESHLGVGN